MDLEEFIFHQYNSTLQTRYIFKKHLSKLSQNCNQKCVVLFPWLSFFTRWYFCRCFCRDFESEVIWSCVLTETRCGGNTPKTSAGRRKRTLSIAFAIIFVNTYDVLRFFVRLYSKSFFFVNSANFVSLAWIGFFMLRN